MKYFNRKHYWSSNPHELMDERPTSKYLTMRVFFSTIFVLMALLLMIFSFWNLMIQDKPERVYYIKIKENDPLLHVTSDKFLSFGIDTSLLRDTQNFPLLNEKFLNLAKYLSPAYVRIGGTAADCLFFNQTFKKSKTQPRLNYNPQNISAFSINAEDFVNLNDFSTKSQLRMIFDLNVLIRNSDNSWNISNAAEIISFAKGHNYELDWQLGNEPNSFRHVFHREVSGIQLADDYKKLRALLNSNGYEDSVIFGPETNHIGDERNNGLIYAKEFLDNSQNSVDYLTWHQYYLNGRIAGVQDFLNATIFNKLPHQIETFSKIFQDTDKRVPTCLSETSTAYGGGAPELSDRFVAGFLWLDKLGYSASAGVKIVIRQSFYGGHYAMIGPDLNPNPDWWISVVFKELVSEKVLHLKTKNNFKDVRLYAHCTPKKALLNRVPSVTVYGVNINEENHVEISLGEEADKDIKLFVYTFTSDFLTSRQIRLNGEILQLEFDGSLPPFKPVIYRNEETLLMPPKSIFFIAIHGLKINACNI